MTDNKKELIETLTGDIEERVKKFEALSDADLEKISGGSWADDWAQWLMCDKSYRSGDTPKYSVGQKVRVYVTGRNVYEGVIVSVGGKTGGINDTEFVYSIRVYGNQFQQQFHPEGWIEERIYESNIYPL